MPIPTRSDRPGTDELFSTIRGAVFCAVSGTLRAVFVTIPRSAPGGRPEPTWAQLILRVRRSGLIDGRFFRTGARVEESALRPSDAWPEVPLLVEFAGSERAGRGHNRSADIHLLWRYDSARRGFDEIARVRSDGAEWLHHLEPIIRRHIRRPPVSPTSEARDAARRVVAALEGELDLLEDEGHERALALIYNQVAARFAASVSEKARALRPVR